MEYKYDPILCMNVPVNKAADASKDAASVPNNKMYYSSNPNLSRKPHMKISGAEINKEAQHGYRVYKMNAETFKENVLPFDKWFNESWMKNFVEANDNDPIKDPDDCPEGMTCDALDEAIRSCDSYKFKIIYDIHKPGTKVEVIEANNVTEAIHYAASHANGWGYEVKRVIDEDIRSCDSGVQYKGFEIVNAGSYYFIRGVNAFKFPTIEEAKEWIDEKESMVKKSGWR